MSLSVKGGLEPDSGVDVARYLDVHNIIRCASPRACHHSRLARSIDNRPDRARRANHLPPSVTCESISSRENIPLRRRPKSPVELPPSRPPEGRSRSSRTWGGMRWTLLSVQRRIGRQGGSTP